MVIQYGHGTTGNNVTLPIALTKTKVVVCNHVGTGAAVVIPAYSHANNLTTNLFIGAQNGWGVNYITIGF